MSDSIARVYSWLLRGFRGLGFAWAMFGIVLLILAILEIAYSAQGALRYSIWSATAGEGARHPYEQLPWFGDYLADERASATAAWSSYVYYRRLPYAGRYITIDSSGLRWTPQPGGAARDTVRIFLMGGSTMFGVSQRDSNTIASVFASRLSERSDQDHTYRVTNFGQSGYVFTQEVIQLLLQLRAGARPDIVVFYDGLNEVSSAVQNGRAGLPQNEANRARDYELASTVYSIEGSDLRAVAALAKAGLERLRIFRRLQLAIATRGAGHTLSDSLATQIAASYANTARAVEALSHAYGFRAIYVWEPSLHHTLKPLTPFEVHLSDLLDSDPFQQRQRHLHRELPGLISTAMAEVAPGRALELSGLFAHDTLPVYTDAMGHNTERAVPVIVDGFEGAVFKILEASGDPADLSRTPSRR